MFEFDQYMHCLILDQVMHCLKFDQFMHCLKFDALPWFIQKILF